MKLNGQLVKTLRKDAGYSAATFGTAIGVGGRHVRRYEAGTSQPSFAVALAMAQALNVDVTDLFHVPEAGTPPSGCGERTQISA